VSPDLQRHDPYAGAAPAWASDAALVYAPLAAELVRRHPGPLAGRLILDAGAGTGLGSAALARAGARAIAIDLSAGMLRWQRGERPPAAVADVTRLPLAASCVDGVLAAFVLNHLPTPGEGLAELGRVTRPGGAVLASVYANVASNGVRDVVDQVAVREGFVVPAWYLELKEACAPQVGTPDTMAEAARGAGLGVVEVEQVAVDVGVHTAEDLVRYRFGQAQYADWFAGLPPERAAEVRAAAVTAVTPVMAPYRPLVVLLVARAT
jgi:SAM-dependent methyltransferase